MHAGVQAQGQTLSLGCILPLSGPKAGTGQAIEQGIRMSIQERASQELTSKVAVKLVCIDSRCDAPGAAEAAAKLVAMGVRECHLLLSLAAAIRVKGSNPKLSSKTLNPKPASCQLYTMIGWPSICPCC